MKKYLSIVLVMAVMTCIFAGCSKKTEDVVTEVNVSSGDNSGANNSSELSYKEHLKSLVSLEELRNFTPEQTKSFFLTNIPNYRESFRISADRELTDEDWNELKDMLLYILYDNIELPEDKTMSEIEQDEIAIIKGTGYANVSEEEKQEIEDYYAYAFLTGDDIRAMTVPTFKLFFKDYMTWLNETDEGYDEQFSKLTDEMWTELQNQVAISLDNSWLEE